MDLKPTERLEDLMIDGLKIIQDENLYRFSSDAVLLSRFAKYRKGDKVADFCSGCGIIGMHFYALHQNVEEVCLFEIQESLASLAERSIEYNHVEDKIKSFNMAIQDIPKEYNNYFSLILCNPPYKRKDAGIKNEEEHIAIARHEVKVTLDEIFEIAHKKLAFKGRLCICQRVERITDILAGLRGHELEPSRLQLVANENNRKPYLVMVEAVKGIKPQMKVEETINN